MQGGFTVVELLVTMAILLLFSGIGLSQYRAFSLNSDFANTGENIVFALREAQVYGAGGKRTDGAGCGTPVSLFNCAYGVNFVNGSGSYNFFVDTNGNSVMDAGESIQTILLGSGATITSLLCVRPSSTGPCVNYASITFKRPSPDALIIETSGVPSYLDGVDITISNGIKTTTVKISSAGQISIR